MSIEQLLRDAGAHLDRMVVEQEQRGPLRSQARPDLHRRLPVLAAAAATALVCMVALTRIAGDGATEVQTQNDDAGGHSGSAVLDHLLFPADQTSGNVVDASVSAMTGVEAAGTVVSPTGNLFAVTILNGVTEVAHADADRRTIGDHVVAATTEDRSVVYSVDEPCAQLVVREMGEDGEAWEAEPAQLLAAVSIDGTAVKIDLPDGWTSLGAGPVDLTYRLTYHVTRHGESPEVTLEQSVGMPLGSLLAQLSGGDFSPVDAAGSPGWLFKPADSDRLHLGWATPAGSALLSASGLSAEDLTSAAQALDAGQAPAWSHQLEAGSASPTEEHTTTTTTTLPAGTRAFPNCERLDVTDRVIG